jgi:DNA-binding transcriptional ArsR family regulator
MSAAAITVGAGKDRPQGRRVATADGLSPANALRAALQDLPATTEAWWSPHLFKAGITRDRGGVPTERPTDYRHGDLWESSLAVAIDADNDGHAAWDDAQRKAVLTAIVNLELPGSMAHFTPHGLRILFPLAESVTDVAAWRRAAAGACSEVGAALSRIDGVRMEIDTSASCDTARFYWTPRAIVDGVARDGQVFFMRDRTWTLEELAGHAPAVPAEPKKAEPVADEILPNDRHETLKRLAASLRGKGLKADEIYAALRQVNERRCKPPKPDTEIRALADYFDKKDGTNLAQGEPPDLKRFTSIAVGMHAFLKRKIDKPISVLGEGIISAFHVTMLVGRGGAGKSWLALMLGRAIARGESFLGLPTPGGGVKVGILELEDHAYDYQQRLAAIAAASGGSDERDDQLEIVTRPDLQGAVRVADQATIDAIVHWIETKSLKVLIVDALKDAHDSEENSNQQMAQIMGTFALICNRTGCAIVILHHESSKAPPDGKEREDAASPRGASALFDNARCVMRIKVHPSGLRKLVFAKVSHGAPPAPIWLSHDKETGVFALAEAPEVVKGENVEKVRDALREAGANGLAVAAIVEETKLSKSTVYDHLKTLEAVSNGAKKHPRYRLVSEASESGTSDGGPLFDDNVLGDPASSASESDEIHRPTVRTVRPKGRNGRSDSTPVSERPDEQPDLSLLTPDGTPR